MRFPARFANWSRNRWALPLMMTALALPSIIKPAFTQQPPEPAVISGIVFQDRNENGTRDPDEPGVSGVSVSDGKVTVETDWSGRYNLTMDPERRLTDIVFISMPDGYVLPVDANQTPRFYRVLESLGPGDRRVEDFALLHRPESLNPDFGFVNLADVHVQAGTTNNRERFTDQIRQLNRLTGDPAFVIVAGDLTNDATDAEFLDYRAATAASKLPVWPAAGNHEFTGGPDYRARIDNYRRHVGPEWYSFDYGNRHFVVLENHQGFSQPDQLEWLKADLDRHARSREVVVIVHKPLNTPQTPVPAADTQPFLNLLGSYKTALVLMGHTHVNDVARDVIPGARHVVTNSSSYTIDQTPNGFRVVMFQGKQEQHPFKMYNVDQSLTIVSPGSGDVMPNRPFTLVVNAYNTSSTVKAVEYSIDGGPWRSLKQSSAFSWAGEWNARWAPLGQHDIQVRVTDDRGATWAKSGAFATAPTSDLQAPQAGTDWPLFHANAQHTGVAADRLMPNLRMAWSHRTPGTILTSSPAVVKGVVYVGTRDENGTRHNGIRAVDFTSGRKLWQFPTEAQVQASPAVAEGLVFASTVRGTLYAIDARTGSKRWERTVGTGEIHRGWMYFSPNVADGVVYQAYTTASGGGVLALDARTGEQRWDSRPASFNNWISEGSPVVQDGRVYVIGQGGWVFALDAETGSLLWSKQPAGGWVHSMPTIADGRLFAGFQNGILVALDALTGNELWRYKSDDSTYIFGNSVGSSPAVDGDTVFMGFHDGNITALDAQTGSRRWSYRTNGGIISSAAVSGDSLYIGSNDGYLYAFDKSTGAPQWRREIGTWVASSPAVSGTGLVVGAFDGNLYGFVLDSDRTHGGAALK
jgi:outer membrane protein assembly factor BamB